MKASKHTRLLLPFMLLLVLGFANVQAQRIQISANYLQGIRYPAEWDLFRGGVELSLDYLYPWKAWNFYGGLDIRTAQWGGQVSVSLGANVPLGTQFEVGAEIQNGLALFRPRPLYTFSTGIRSNYLFLQREKLTLGASLEVRFTVCPAYRKYSQINRVLEIPVGLLVRF